MKNDRLVLGFSGTRAGMTDAQLVTVGRVIDSVGSGFDELELHHGDCVGADAQAHHLVTGLVPVWRVRIVTHPPEFDKLRARCEGFHEERPAAPYLIRNRHIVDASDVMIATPRQRKPQRRGSGTWQVIRYARATGKKLYVVWPDGSQTNPPPR